MMNILGVDLQDVLAAVCLREGSVPKWPPPTIGDGRREVILSAETRWGGRACAAPALQASEQRDRANSSEEEPWTEEGGMRRFWEGLSGRLRSFLGGVEPARYIHRIVVVLYTDDFQRACDRVRRHCQYAGFVEPHFIPAGRAALIAAQQVSDSARVMGTARVVAVVAIADRCVQVFAYRLEGSDPISRAVSAAKPITIAQTGSAFWIGEVLHAVRECCAEWSDNRATMPALWQAAMELGARLSLASDDAQDLDWTGPLREKMSVPLRFCRRDSLRQESIVRLTQQLPTALARAAQDIGEQKRPDLIILCGTGAVWPFAERAVSAVGPVWRVDRPELAIARGAAWWTELGEHCFADGLADEPGAVPGLARPSGQQTPGPLQAAEDARSAAPACNQGAPSKEHVGDSVPGQASPDAPDLDLISRHREGFGKDRA